MKMMTMMLNHYSDDTVVMVTIKMMGLVMIMLMNGDDCNVDDGQ